MLLLHAAGLRRARRTPLNRRSDFTRLLDDLEAGAEEASSGQAPHIPFSLANEGLAFASASLRPPVGFAAAEYQAHSEPVAPPQAAAARPLPPLPSLDPAEVAAELALAGAGPAALVRARRDFAFRNHPDRVAAPLRERAARRMQIANALIDEALRRVAARRA